MLAQGPSGIPPRPGVGGQVKSLAGFIRAAALSAILGGTVIVGLGVVTTGTSSAAVRPANSCYPIGSTNCGGMIQVPRFAWRDSAFAVKASGFVPGTNVTIRVCNIGTVTTTANSSGAVWHGFFVPPATALGACKVTASGTGDNTTLYLTTSVVIQKYPSHTYLILHWQGIPGHFVADVYVFPVVRGTPPRGLVSVWAYDRNTGSNSRICAFFLRYRGSGTCKFVLPRGSYFLHAFYGGNQVLATSRSIELYQHAR